MTSEEASGDDMLDRLMLEIKAIALLYGDETDLRGRLENKITESHDENIRKFVRALQNKKSGGAGRLLAIALGELLMASLLVLAGAVVLVPTVVGVNTLSGLVQYFAARLSEGQGGTILSPYLAFIEFVVGAILVLTAFFALREAASNLKEAGLTVRSGEY
ncbi:MAG: hypothetical protein KGI38_00275 [Thaumarchaeota archaeon]|nr:hypothetical protein [Nitrososphaerota archaeon]